MEARFKQNIHLNTAFVLQGFPKIEKEMVEKARLLFFPVSSRNDVMFNKTARTKNCIPKTNKNMSSNKKNKR